MFQLLIIIVMIMQHKYIWYWNIQRYTILVIYMYSNWTSDFRLLSTIILDNKCTSSSLKCLLLSKMFQNISKIIKNINTIYYIYIIVYNIGNSSNQFTLTVVKYTVTRKARKEWCSRALCNVYYITVVAHKFVMNDNLW